MSKFNCETNPECTFYAINGPFPVPREDFSHIFFNCPSTKKIIEEVFDEYMTISFTTCSVFFGGNIAEKEETNRPFQLVMDILRYYIWTSKLEKKAPVKQKNLETLTIQYLVYLQYQQK